MKCKYIKRDTVSRMLHIGSLLFLNLFQAFSDLFFAVPIYRLRPSFLWENAATFLTIWFTVLLNTLSPVDSYLNYSTACSKTADGFSSVHSRINVYAPYWKDMDSQPFYVPQRWYKVFPILPDTSLCFTSVDNQLLCSGRSTLTLFKWQLEEIHFVLTSGRAFNYARSMLLT